MTGNRCIRFIGGAQWFETHRFASARRDNGEAATGEGGRAIMTMGEGTTAARTPVRHFSDLKIRTYRPMNEH
jgi:hypothetical protein